MDNYPYSYAAFTNRRELEPSMLNGDAHHSLTREVELRIGRCIHQVKSPQSIAEAALVSHELMQEFWHRGKGERGIGSPANDCFSAPKAQNITAWGNAPGTRSTDTGSAEGA